MVLPLNNPEITSEYGIRRKDGKLHKGIDLISSTKERSVRAISDGRVSYCGYDQTGFGNYVVILQRDGYKALYCHLEKYNVIKNDKVKKGEIIGVEGTSGNSTGVHLHLELRKYPYGPNNYINVAEYLGIENKKGTVKFLKKEDENMPRYNKLEEIPEWGKATVEKLMNLELLKGNENGDLDLSHDMLRIFVIEDRAGLYDL